MAQMESHWELDNSALLDRAFPEFEFDSETAQEIKIELVDRLESETGILFNTEDAGRIGNLDVFRHLSGDFRLQDGLYCRTLRTYSQGQERLSLVVWLEQPLQDLPALLVGCRLFNGGGPTSRTCILSEVKNYSRDEKLSFVAQEPFSIFEVSVWSEQRLVSYRTFGIVREISLGMNVSGSARRVRTKWSESLPPKLRDRAESIPSNTSQLSTIGSGDADPWRAAESAATSTVRTGFARKPAGRYFGISPASQLESIEFLRDLILRPEVNRVIIVDPFFDGIGVQSLLVKLQMAKEVVVLASHTTASGGKTRLFAECEKLRDLMPRSLSVINIETPGEGIQQFHDRYVLIEMNSEAESELWMLSNSFSSMAKSYPLVILPLPPDVASEVAGYIREVERGKPPGKSHAKRQVIWTKAPADPTPRPVAPAPTGFEGSDTLLSLLVSDRGLLAGWRVPADALPIVVGAVKGALAAFADDPSNRAQLLMTIARWYYHGGPAPFEYHFEETEILWLAEAFRQLLLSEAGEGMGVELEVLQNGLALPECLDTIWYLVHQIPFEVRRATNPALYFFALALWTDSPQAIADILDETNSASLFCWLCMEGSQAGETQVRCLLSAKVGSVKALGFVLLRECCQRESEIGKGRLAELLGPKLMASPLPQEEAWLALVFVETRVPRSPRLSPTLFEQSAKAWTVASFSNEMLVRLTSVIARAAPRHAIEFVGILAEACTFPDWREALHRWCIDQMLSQLRLKRPIAAQQGVRNLCDAETVLAAARSIWKAHGNQTSEWFNANVLKNLKISDALVPLLRTSNYSEWSAAVDSVMLGLWLGRAIAQVAPCPEDGCEFAARTAPLMSKTVDALGPEIWRAYVQKYEQLLCVVAFIGSSAEYCDEVGLADIEQLALRDGVPSLWRLWLKVQSPKLMLKHTAAIESLASRPSTGTSCYSDEITGWCNRMNGALDHLETLSQLREILASIRRGIGLWCDGFEL